MAKKSARQIKLLQRLKEIQPSEISQINEFLPELFRYLQDSKPRKEDISVEFRTFWDDVKNIEAVKLTIPASAIKFFEDSLPHYPQTTKIALEAAIEKEAKITFLLGAGASVASNIPIVEDLLPQLWRRAKRIGRKNVDELADWCSKNGIRNIENLLTAADISNLVAQNRDVASLLEFFLIQEGDVDYDEYAPDIVHTSQLHLSSVVFHQDTLQMLFGLLASTMLSAKPNDGHIAIADFIKQHNRVSIITTNYDICMDETLFENNIKVVDYLDPQPKGRDKNVIDLLKMHGSVHWSYCDSCQKVTKLEIDHIKKQQDEGKFAFPLVSVCSNCTGLSKPLLVPPTFQKLLTFPNLIDIWYRARKLIKETDFLIVVGFSFAEADTYISKIIFQSLLMNKHQKLIIIDPNSSLIESIKEKLAARGDSFDTSRVLGILEKSEIALPKLLMEIVTQQEEYKSKISGDSTDYSHGTE